jgi:hypothetical protein
MKGETHEETDRTGSNPGADRRESGVGPVGEGSLVSGVLREVDADTVEKVRAALKTAYSWNEYYEVKDYGPLREEALTALDQIAAALDVVAKARLEREWEA